MGLAGAKVGSVVAAQPKLCTGCYGIFLALPRTTSGILPILTGMLLLHLGFAVASCYRGLRGKGD